LYTSTENFRKFFLFKTKIFKEEKFFVVKYCAPGHKVRKLRIFRGIVAAHGARAESDQRKKLRSSAKDMGIKSAFFGDFNSLCAPEPISFTRNDLTISKNGA
jgi:hypothetical protein